MTPIFIDSAEQLATHLARWESADFLAIDTEFVREQTYYPILCLIQISDGGDNVCIDPLAIPDLEPLFELLRQSSAIKVFHAASQDLEIFVRLAGACPLPLFDTQIAAAMLGYGDQLGYAGLVSKMMDVQLDKSLSRTNWARRPLSEKELAYAADDVRYLAQIYPRLRDELQAKSRLDWHSQDCINLSRAERYRAVPDLEWRRLKGLARLSARAQNVAAAIAAWRETLAEERDRPRRWILSDEALYALAERQPERIEQLSDLLVLPPKIIEKHGSILISLIQETLSQDKPALIEETRADDTRKQLMKRVLDKARAIATDLNIPPSLLAPRADIEALVDKAGAADIALLKGWRREVAGDTLLSILP